MKEFPSGIRRAIIAICVGAPLTFLALSWAYPATWEAQVTIAFLILAPLAVAGELLAVQSPEISPTLTISVTFLIQLAAITLLYPLHVGIIALLCTITHWQRKPFFKILYNSGQMLLAGMVGCLFYYKLGGQPGLETLTLKGGMLPFLGAMVGYGLTNTLALSHVMAVVQKQNILEIWWENFGRVLFFNMTISPMSFLIAYGYIEWGWGGLLLGVAPILGLRFSYLAHIKATQMNQDLLRVMIRSLEARDAYTSGHSLRVAERARRIGREMGLKIGELRTVETAALLHDIGKIDEVYAEILSKDGKLTDSEFDLIKEHPGRGVDILESVESMDKDILPCVRHHHERWEGGGYPEGIAGEEIPLGARIIAVADTIDAMRTSRPYRDPISMEGVREEILACKGTQFDPQVVEAALEAGLFDNNIEQEVEEEARDHAPGTRPMGAG